MSHFLHPCPPAEFAFSCKPDSDSADSHSLTARKRADYFSTNVLFGGEFLSFTRTYFENLGS